MKLVKSEFGEVSAWHREGGDAAILKEVIVNACYRRKSVGFDVMSGETWLDLGANIGAFALYCKSKGAQATCFEPDLDCFDILKRNVPKFELFNSAVSASKEAELVFYQSNAEANHSRGTVVPVRGYTECRVANTYAGELKKLKFSGVKMDIEGSEGPILDQWLLPRCSKLCLEYHTSRDRSVTNLECRLDQLRKHFNHVCYPPEYDRAITSGLPEVKTFFDRMIFAWGPK